MYNGVHTIVTSDLLHYLTNMLDAPVTNYAKYHN